MENSYTRYTEVTRAILETVKVGDWIKINDRKRPLNVKGVTENYFVMAQIVYGVTLYSVVSKRPWRFEGAKHNAMSGGMFHCGPDAWLFGYKCLEYDFENLEFVADYLNSFERGESEISERRGMPIQKIYIKSSSLREENS